MNFKRVVNVVACVLGLMVVNSESNASYELTLVVDAGTKSIKRFDPFSGAYLGEFGKGMLINPQGITFDSSGVAYVVDNYNPGFYSGIKKFNYSTGEYLGNMYLSAPYDLRGITIGPDGNLWAVDSHPSHPNIYGITKNGALIRTYGDSRLAGASGITVEEGKLLIAKNNGYAMYDIGINFLTNDTVLNYAFSDVAISTQYLGSYLARYFIQTNTNTVYSSGYSMFPIPISQLDKVKGLSVGHQMIYISGQQAGSPSAGRIVRLDPTLNNIMSYFGDGYLTTPTYMATVTAPEPASLAAIGIGVVGLVAHRRRKRSKR